MQQFIKKQHIISAGFIAQFSDRKQKKLRESPISYYDRRADKILLDKAENILYEDNYFEIDSSILNILTQDNLIETTLTELEGKFINIINNKNFANNTEEKDIILHYMLSLFLRTPKKRELILTDLSREVSKNYSDPQRVDKHKSNLQAMGLDSGIFDDIRTSEGLKTIANMLHSMSVIGYKYENPIYKAHFNEFNSYKYHFLEINNHEEFICGDNPIVFGSRVILFPISSRDCLVGIHKKSLNTLNFEIDLINKAIASNADNVIFGSSESLVKKYVPYFKDKDLSVLKYLDLN